MIGAESWNSSATELLRIFRQSLKALIPTMEMVKIGWRDEDAYDDWDEICAILYKSIVANSIADELNGSAPLISFGVRCESYSKNSFIGISTRNAGYSAFVKFKTGTEPFDLVDVAILDEALGVIRYDTIPSQSTEFNLNINVQGSIRQATTISVII
jgi:hypothetical protein